jgi:hypothetical protein
VRIGDSMAVGGVITELHTVIITDCLAKKTVKAEVFQMA